MANEKGADLRLPDTVPGTAEDLAEIALRVIGGGSRNPRQKDQSHIQLIAEQLRDIASTVLEDLKHQDSSPSAKELEKQLERICRLSESLTEALHSLPPFSRDLLNTAYHTQRGWDNTAKVFVDLGLGTAPAELAANAIHAAAQQELDGWRKGTALGRIPPAQPGPQRAFRRIVGDPRVFLADRVAQMVVREQGAGVVTAEETGPVYEVVALLWTHATGLPDEGANLRHYVRRGARSAALLGQLRAVQDQINQDRQEFYANPANLTNPQVRQDFLLRIEMLETQTYTLLARAHAALWDDDRDISLDPPSG